MNTFARKLFISAALMVCAGASAQTGLGDILSKVKEAAEARNNTDGKAKGGVLSTLTGVFSKNKVATKELVTGTWVYEEPAVVFKSDNILKKSGGKLAASLIEKKLQEKLEKYGFKKGMVSMSFDKNGNFEQKLRGKSLKGTYTIDGKNIILKYAGKVSQFVGTTQVDGDCLLIVMDASKLLKYVNALGKYSNDSRLKAATSLLGSMDGMECGLLLRKQK